MSSGFDYLTAHPGEYDPPKYFAAQRDGRHGHGEVPHPAVRQRREGVGVKALVFDCDGVLADTERYGHLPAFNQVFQEFGVPARTGPRTSTPSASRSPAARSGWPARSRPRSSARPACPTTPTPSPPRSPHWHKRKTAIYTEMVAAGQLPPRPGIRRIIAEAQDAGWKLAVASTSAEASVRAILDQAAGPDRAARFDALLAGDCVAHKKPAPDIYLLALERLGADPADVLVVEDSRNGLEAAHAAGLRCVVTVNGYTEAEDFTEAVLVVSSLGDPDGRGDGVLANRSAARPGRLRHARRPRGLPGARLAPSHPEDDRWTTGRSAPAG